MQTAKNPSKIFWVGPCGQLKISKRKQKKAKGQMAKICTDLNTCFNTTSVGLVARPPPHVLKPSRYFMKMRIATKRLLMFLCLRITTPSANKPRRRQHSNMNPQWVQCAINMNPQWVQCGDKCSHLSPSTWLRRCQRDVDMVSP